MRRAEFFGSKILSFFRMFSSLFEADSREDLIQPRPREKLREQSPSTDAISSCTKAIKQISPAAELRILLGTMQLA